MKRHLIIYTAAAAIAAMTAVASCKPQYEPLPDTKQDGLTLVAADFESVFDSEGLWSENSYLGVFGSERGSNERYIIKSADVNHRTASFYGPIVKGAALTAYYPYSEAYSGSTAAMPVTLDPDQEYVENASALDQYLRYATRVYGYQTAAGHLKFVHPFGMMRVRVDLEKAVKVSGMTLSCPEGSIAGLGVFSADGSVAMDETSARIISLDCGDGVTSSQGGELTDFYIVAAYGVYPKMTLTIGIDGEDPAVCELNDITIERISKTDFTLTPVTVRSTGLGTFEVVDVHFNE